MLTTLVLGMRSRQHIGLATLIFAGLSVAASAEPPQRWGDWPAWGDQGDGTYRNPVLPADYSDIDCIRVGSDYYAITSTFQFSPGVAILHSRDLVNWQTAGHAVPDITQISPELNWDRMNRAGRGIWAGAIRHHAGRFWITFGTPDEGYFMTSAPDVAGPWTPLHCLMSEAGWDDCCPFWDDDGQGWFIGTHFRDGYKTWLFKLSADGRTLDRASAVLLNEGLHREANKLYKIDGAYYHFFSEHRSETGRYVMMQRAKNITGPYTEVRQLSHAQREVMEPNQGGLVQTENGAWYFLTHHGTGQWEGRAASLLPVTWIDGWPILGAPGEDGVGNFVWSGRKPVAGEPVTFPQGSDDFSSATLALPWEWNYQPRAAMWSLTERPGFLRQHAFRSLDGAGLKKIGNILTQRSARTHACEAIVRLDLNGMTDGQVAGLCHFARTFSAIQIRHEAGQIALELTTNGNLTPGPTIPSSTLWLRSTWGLDGLNRYAYSEDGIRFIELGEPDPLTWGHYRGDRIGVFTYNNSSDSGYVDVDSFTYRLDQTKQNSP